MDQFVTQALTPGIALIVSVATFVFTQVRASQINGRVAAKDTVEILAAQNTALHSEITTMQTRAHDLENQLSDCENKRAILMEIIVNLKGGSR